MTASIVLGAVLAFAFSPDSQALRYSLRQWPSHAFKIEDAYKWLHQQTLGPGHAVASLAQAKSWMDREWRGLRAEQAWEPSVVPLDPEGRVLRVNLRPYRDAKGDSDMLAAAIYLSAERFKPNKDAFRRLWRELGRKLRDGAHGVLTYGAWRKLESKTRPQGYPAIDHSAAYLAAYKPAYRVVASELWIGSRVKGAASRSGR